jgi:hypothetical protein
VKKPTSFTHNYEENEDQYLLIADVFTVQTDRRFHGEEGYRLHQMALYNVTDDSMLIEGPDHA